MTAAAPRELGVLEIARGAGDGTTVLQRFEVPFEPGASVLDGLIVLQPHPLHPHGHLLGAEHPHQIIFERQVKATAPWIPLASAATPQL